MRRVRFVLLAAFVPALALAIALTGCGGGDKASTGSGDGGGKSDGGPKAKTAVEGKGHGTLKGRVVYDGTPPDMTKANEEMEANQKTKPECLVGASEQEKAAYKWVVNKNKGVKNVIVWLSPGDNAYFKLSDAEKKPAKAKVEIDQPHCAFEPHCSTAFTVYYDGKKYVPTGQIIEFKNNSKGIAHNTNFKLARSGAGNNLTLQPGDILVAKEANKPDQISVECNIHTWMRAYIRNLDHPFSAVTDDEGNFEIKDVPTGVPVHVVIWHEVAEYGPNGSKGKAVTLKDGENVENFKIKGK